MMPVTCATTTVLTLGLIGAALQLAADTPIEPGDVQETPTCYLQAGHGGAHYGLVIDLEDEAGSAVWAAWGRSGTAYLLVLPACAAHSDSRMDVCGEPDGHAGGHTWQIRDPLMEVARAQLARIPLAGP